MAAWMEPAKLSFPFSHSLRPGRGEMRFGEEGLTNKVEIGVVTFTSCLFTSYP